MVMEELSDFVAKQVEVDRLFQEVGHRKPFRVDIFVAEPEWELLVDGGEHQDGEVAEPAPDLAGEMKPTAGIFGEHDIQHDSVRAAFRDRGEGFLSAVNDLDLVAKALAHGRYGGGEVRVIIDNKEVSHNSIVVGGDRR